MLASAQPTKTSVAAIMTRSVQTVEANDFIVEALRFMADGINSLPVVNHKGDCIGVLSRADLAEPLLKEDQQLAQIIESEGTPNLFGSALETCNVRLVHELMSDQVRVVDETTSIKQACILMASNEIHHLPVVNQERKVVGIVSSLDLIQWFAQ